MVNVKGLSRMKTVCVLHEGDSVSVEGLSSEEKNLEVRN